MRAYVLTHVRTGQELDVVQAIKRFPGIVRADFTLGPYDVIMEVEAPNLAAIGKVIFETIRCQPGVIDTLTCLAVE